MSHRSNRTVDGADARISQPTVAGATPLEPRRLPRQERARATVAAITEAAAQLLVERGYAKVSTNLIARQAGVSVGSLYQYFPNKESIYAAILDGHVAEMRTLGERALVVLADPALSFPAALRRVLESLVDVHRRDDDLMRVLEVELRQVFPHWRKPVEGEDELADHVARIIAARADCRTDRPEVAARLVLILCQEVTRWLLHRAPRGVEAADYLEHTVRMCELAVGFHGDLAGNG